MFLQPSVNNFNLSLCNNINKWIFKNIYIKKNITQLKITLTKNIMKQIIVVPNRFKTHLYAFCYFMCANSAFICYSQKKIRLGFKITIKQQNLLTLNFINVNRFLYSPLFCYNAVYFDLKKKIFKYTNSNKKFICKITKV